MKPVIAYDVYGTLIDPLGVTDRLVELVGDKAGPFAQAWRDKQIEYLFRRALGRRYERFSVCTLQALDYTCRRFSIDLDRSQRIGLLAAYLELPAYPGVASGLMSLRDSGCRNFAFSNGEPGDLEVLLARAGLTGALDGIVSVDPVQSYKPDPAVYEHFLLSARAEAGSTWLVSANPFDIIGAACSGWNTAWLCRSPDMQFDPWGIEPTITVAEIGALVGALD